MTILFTALAIAGAPATAAVQPAPPAMHAMPAQAQHSPPGVKPQGMGCGCCKDMAAGGKMQCCAKHGEDDGTHSGHGAKR